MSKNRAAGLLEPELLARLERLALKARRLYGGLSSGARQTRHRGVGIELAGYRAYAPGDDLRDLDWALLGRLDRPFIKMYDEERDLPVHFLLDASRSMGFGEPSKFLVACRVAAALGYVALAGLDPVSVACFDGAGLRRHAPSRGRGAYSHFLHFLSSVSPDGSAGGEDAIRLHAALTRPGLTVVFSDFLDPDFREALHHHMARRHSLVLVQMLSAQELDPPFEGDLKLVDSELGDEIELTVGPSELAAYRARLRAFREDLRDFGRRHGIEVFSFSSDSSLEQILWKHLFRGLFLGKA